MARTKYYDYRDREYEPVNKDIRPEYLSPDWYGRHRREKEDFSNYGRPGFSDFGVAFRRGRENYERLGSESPYRRLSGYDNTYRRDYNEENRDNVFKRAGRKIKQAWNEWTDNDEDYYPYDEDRSFPLYGNRNEARNRFTDEDEDRYFEDRWNDNNKRSQYGQVRYPGGQRSWEGVNRGEDWSNEYDYENRRSGYGTEGFGAGDEPDDYIRNRNTQREW